MGGHSSIIHDSQKTETTQMYINLWMDKENVITLHHVIWQWKKKKDETHWYMLQYRWHLKILLYHFIMLRHKRNRFILMILDAKSLRLSLITITDYLDNSWQRFYKQVTTTTKKWLKNFFFLVVLGIGPRALSMLGKHPIIEQHSSP
jgi:hypothetical protein